MIGTNMGMSRISVLTEGDLSKTVGNWYEKKQIKMAFAQYDYAFLVGRFIPSYSLRPLKNGNICSNSRKVIRRRGINRPSTILRTYPGLGGAVPRAMECG